MVSLTPEERFRLILAASGRGDEAERDRLVNAAERITLSMPDHSPFAHAFSELALLVFVEMLEDAARYNDAFARPARPATSSATTKPKWTQAPKPKRRRT